VFWAVGYLDMAASGSFQTCAVQIKKTSTFRTSSFKSKTLVVHPTLLSYYDESKCSWDEMTNPSRKRVEKCDFLLAPLGFTEIVQVREEFLLVISKCKKVRHPKTNNVTELREPVVVQQFTIQFASRKERDAWMKIIISECDKRYLKGLISSKSYFSDDFLEAATMELWTAVFLGDEPLRKAYTARDGSHELTYVSEVILETVIKWLRVMLGVSDKFLMVHRKAFVAMWSLMLSDAAARAMFLLMRPTPDFLEQFTLAHAADVPNTLSSSLSQRSTTTAAPSPTAAAGEGEGGEEADRGGGGDEAAATTALSAQQKKRLRDSNAALSFVEYVRSRVQAAEWKKFRTFLAVIDHPSMKLKEGSSAVSYEEVSTTPKQEVDWLRSNPAPVFEMSWDLFETALSDSPYLSYFYVKMEIEEVIDDIKIRKVRALLEKVPPEHIQMSFVAENSRVRLRQHFLALIDYSKFYELWKYFLPERGAEQGGGGADRPGTETDAETRFFDAVHMNIWSRIASTDDPGLRKLFLPETIATTAADFADSLGSELAVTGNSQLLHDLKIAFDRPVSLDASASARLLSENVESFRYFQKMVLDRLMSWVKRIVSQTVLREEDAPIYVLFLVASLRSPSVRSVLWLTEPASASVINDFTGETSKFEACSQFLALLEKQVDPKNAYDRFLSFLIVVEHPLAAVYFKQNQGSTVFNRADAALKSSQWCDEIDWLKKFSDKDPWQFSAKQLMSLVNNSPYFTLQLLSSRVSTEQQQSSLEWMKLIKKLPNDVLVTRFEADIDLCASTSSNSSPVADRRDSHFLSFVDSRRVLEIWKTFQTQLLESDEDFRGAAQNQLLLALEKERSAPSKNEKLISGFCKMMFAINKYSAAAKDAMKLTFSTVVVISVWTSISYGDEMWGVLQSFFQNGVATDPSTQAQPTVAAFGSLTRENLVTFRNLLDFFAKWTVLFFHAPSLNFRLGVAFADFFDSCLDNCLLRAVCMIIKSRVPMHANSSEAFQSAQYERFTKMLANLGKNKDSWHLLYLLHILNHPGVSQDESGSLKMVEPKWDDENKWLWDIEHKVSILFDPADYDLLDDPPYLLFRYISRNFANIEEENIKELVSMVQKLDNVEKPFLARDNYLPCRQSDTFFVSSPVREPHFKHLLAYSLYHELWKVIMSPLLDSNLDQGFAQKVVYGTWQLLTSNVYPNLCKLLLPSASDLHWNHLSYVVAVQRHAMITVVKEERISLSKIYSNFRVEKEDIASQEDICAHNLLIKRIMKWVHSLVGGDKNHLQEVDASLFVDILVEATTDVVMRAFLVIFLPAPSMVLAFLASMEQQQQQPFSPFGMEGGQEQQQQQQSPRTRSPSPRAAERTPLRSYSRSSLRSQSRSPIRSPTAGSSAAGSPLPTFDAVAAARQLIHNLAATLRSESWQPFRSFLALLDHPACDAATRKMRNVEPLWSAESVWIQERLQQSASIYLTWQELQYAMTDTPYIFLLLVTKAITNATLQKSAMLAIPPKFLLENFSVGSNSNNTASVAGSAPHFIAMCLNEDTCNIALEVFQKQNMINDRFFEALMHEACKDSNHPKLLPAFKLVQKFLMCPNESAVFPEDIAWNLDRVRAVPNISSVLINFLSEISEREIFRMDQKIVGNFILLVLQLESCRFDGSSVAENTTLISAWMRIDEDFVCMVS
jgi:hypothetical protein